MPKVMPVEVWLHSTKTPAWWGSLHSDAFCTGYGYSGPKSPDL